MEEKVFRGDIDMRVDFSNMRCMKKSLIHCNGKLHVPFGTIHSIQRGSALEIDIKVLAALHYSSSNKLWQ